MIFLTTGHQTPFDRLVRLVDEWAELDGRTDVFAQIGRAAYRPTRFPSRPFLPRKEFGEKIREASAVVAHAGTGTIIEVLLCGKPLLVMPRRASLGETRNDHQVATARRFQTAGYVLAGFDGDEMLARLREIESFRPSRQLSPGASPEILERLRGFLFARG